MLLRPFSLLGVQSDRVGYPFELCMAAGGQQDLRGGVRHDALGELGGFLVGHQHSFAELPHLRCELVDDRDIFLRVLLFLRGEHLFSLVKYGDVPELVASVLLLFPVEVDLGEQGFDDEVLGVVSQSVQLQNDVVVQQLFERYSRLVLEHGAAGECEPPKPVLHRIRIVLLFIRVRRVAVYRSVEIAQCRVLILIETAVLFPKLVEEIVFGGRHQALRVSEGVGEYPDPVRGVDAGWWLQRVVGEVSPRYDRGMVLELVLVEQVTVVLFEVKRKEGHLFSL